MQAQFQRNTVFRRTDQWLCLYHSSIIEEMENTFVLIGTKEQINTVLKLKGNDCERTTEFSKKQGTEIYKLE